MKILGGKLKGRNFYMPAGIRPSQNMTRKAVFDLVGHDLTDLEFLDLFAGSGAVGIEALSRGARKVTFVERESRCVNVIEENFGILGLKEERKEGAAHEIIRGDTFAAIKMFAKKKRKFDIVFLDPPYGKGLAKKALKTLMAYDILQPNCLVILEFRKREDLPDPEGRFFLVTKRKYGRAFLSVYQNGKQ